MKYELSLDLQNGVGWGGKGSFELKGTGSAIQGEFENPFLQKIYICKLMPSTRIKRDSSKI